MAKGEAPLNKGSKVWSAYGSQERPAEVCGDTANRVGNERGMKCRKARKVQMTTSSTASRSATNTAVVQRSQPKHLHFMPNRGSQSSAGSFSASVVAEVLVWPREQEHWSGSAGLPGLLASDSGLCWRHGDLRLASAYRPRNRVTEISACACPSYSHISLVAPRTDSRA